MNGDMRTVWGKLCEDGYYDWDWDKFECWVSCNWKKLSKEQQDAVDTLVSLYKNLQPWLNEQYTERHHLFPRGMGGRPSFGEGWCVRLTYS